MSGDEVLLDRVQPLADPLRVLAITLLVAGFAMGIYVLILSAIQGHPGIGVVLALVQVLGAFATVSLVAPHGRPNAIYLRAFRSDKLTEKLRTRLSAILGGGFRLSGIRPPRKRSSVFTRFLLPGVLVLRYGGSRFMELEAGDDWLARLWKTYQSIRVAFLDVRDLTPYVHQEIQLTQRALGAARCVYIIDDQHTESEWRSIIAGISGEDAQQEHLQLLDVSDESSGYRNLSVSLRQLIDPLPDYPAGETAAGRDFITANVDPILLAKSGRPSRKTFLGATAGLVLSLFVGALMNASFIPEPIRTIYLLVLIVFSAVIILLAVARAVARGWRFLQEGHRRDAIQAWLRLLPITFIALLWMAVTWLFVPGLIQIKHRAEATSAVASLRFLNTVELEYESTYPERGFTCSLAALGGNGPAPTAEGAELITPDLAAGQKSGYVFTFSDCTGVNLSGGPQVNSYKLFATPQKPGSPGYCTDENGEIREDPTGGKNCTIPLQ